MITKDAACENEMKRRLALDRSAMGNMKNLWKDRGITLDTKVKLVQTLVFPIVLSGAETWTLRKDLRKRIDAFELWCWRRILRTSWTARQTNSWVIGMINSKWTLESRVAKP